MSGLSRSMSAVPAPGVHFDGTKNIRSPDWASSRRPRYRKWYFWSAVWLGSAVSSTPGSQVEEQRLGGVDDHGRSQAQLFGQRDGHPAAVLDGEVVGAPEDGEDHDGQHDAGGQPLPGVAGGRWPS